ncbi:Bug family tripartite tricarboxylate transporter substrate binding protein [Falsiroseomonas sp. CW058]|uniref:Bug family tripartite tricarboxylate transporter substrate binding protein n=1 Tax=Falsiroseomonas sp. CW058 TaxID=3388664 RepID=UPI003D314431
MRRSEFLKAMGAGLLATPAGLRQAAAQGQDFPSRSVRLVSGFAPGGGTDILARLVAPRFAEGWRGTGMVVENRSGGSGTLGAIAVARAPADGHTLLLMPNSQTILHHVQRNSGFDLPNDLAPVGMIATSPLVLAVRAGLPVRSIAELVALDRADPGRLNHGSAGSATAPHMAGELFNIMAGTRLAHVPYRGSGPAVTALVSSEVDMSFNPYNSIEGFVRDGRLRVIAVLGAQRYAGLPDVPTVAESGYPGYEVDLWYALMAPAGTPAPLVARINADLNRVLAEPATARGLAERGFLPAPGPPGALAAVIRADLARWKTVTDRIEVRLD